MEIFVDQHPPGSSRPKEGVLLARRGDVVVGQLAYGLGPGERVIRSKNYYVEPHARRTGVGAALASALFDAYSDHEIAEGGSSNSEAGERFLDALRNRGFEYHDSDCFSGAGCCCGLGGRRRS